MNDSIPTNPPLPTELKLVQKILQEKMGISFSSVTAENESQEYKAATCLYKGSKILFRVAKITPRKIGQFVTFWERDKSSKIIKPFAYEDNISAFIIFLSQKENKGCFIFNKEVLLRNGILSKSAQGGKRAFRVYPPWVQPTSKVALKTQQWQLLHFINFDSKESVFNEEAYKMLSNEIEST